MKNKKLLYILIPLTIFIWGMIIYRIVASSNSGNDNQVLNAQHIENNTVDTLNETFSIDPSYRDPFLGKRLKQNSESNNPTANSVATSVKPVKNIPVISSWPTVVYLGIIKNQKSNKQFTLVQINGQSYSMKIGETEAGIQLVKVYKDSIEMKFGKEKRFFKK